MKIKNNRVDIDSCRFCFMCRHVCTTSRITNEELMTPRARALILSLVLRNAIDYSIDISREIYNCCLCGHCKYWCQGGMDLPSAIINARFDLVERDLIPEKVKKLKETLVNNNNPYGIEKKSINLKLNNMILSQPDQHENLVIFGSAILYQNPDVGISAIQLLKKLNIKFATIKNEISSGLDLYCIGYLNEAKAKNEKLLIQIKKSKCQDIIILADDVYHLLKTKIKEMGFNLKNIKIYHISEYLVKLLKNNRLKLKKDMQKSFTYHDPNYLARYNKVIEEPRTLFNLIEKSKFVEMRRSREEANSIGNAIINYTNHELCKKMVESRLEEVKDTNVDLLIVSSGEDKESFLSSSIRPKKLEVLSIVELINQLL